MYGFRFLPVNDGRENKILAGLCDAAEVVGDGQKSLQLREVLHSNLLDRRAELQVLLSVYEVHLDLGQVLVERLQADLDEKAVKCNIIV